jgi:hypothetical protein
MLKFPQVSRLYSCRVIHIKRQNPSVLKRFKAAGVQVTAERAMRIDAECEMPPEKETSLLAAELFNQLARLATFDPNDRPDPRLLRGSASGTLSAPAGAGDGDGDAEPGAPMLAFELEKRPIEKHPAAKGGRLIGWVKLHPDLYAHLTAPRTLHQVAAQLRNAPMLIPPHPWSSPTSGPYLITPIGLVRTRSKLQQSMLQRPETNLEQVYKVRGLSALFSCDLHWRRRA